MKRTTAYCASLALVLLMFVILACGDAPASDPPEYCSLDPKPLICP